MATQSETMLSIRKIVRLLLLFSIIAYVGSAPVGDAPASNVNSTTAGSKPKFEPAFVAGPSKRGTLIIIFSCVLTLILCVWTTVHSNIEPEVWDEDEVEGADDEGVGEFNRNKLLWSVATLLFPEVALWIAAHERKTAQILASEMRNIQIDGVNVYAHWTPVLAYYAIMGGLVVGKTREVSEQPSGTSNESGRQRPQQNNMFLRSSIASTPTDTDKQPMIVNKEGERLVLQQNDLSSSLQSNTPDFQYNYGFPGCSPRISEPLPILEEEEWSLKRRTLTPRGVLRLAQRGIIPQHITLKTIKDKNKASFLAKVLVCFQAIWIIIQVVGRYISRMPVTLLELYTVLHTFCAVAMYVTWIKKPFDVKQPSLIRLRPHELEYLLDIDDHKKKRMPIDVFWHANKGGYADSLTQRAGLGKLLFRQLWNWEDHKKADHFLEDLRLILDAYIALWNGWRDFRWEALALSLVGFAYGGLHLLAWNYDFPSSTEHTIWQIASVSTSGAFFGFCVTIPGGYFGMWIWEKVIEKKEETRQATQNHEHVSPGEEKSRPMGEKISWIFNVLWDHGSDKFFRWCLYVFITGFLLAIIPCILARFYLLVEAFVSMRRLPIGSYDMVQWGNFVPHFG